jgi:cytosine/adenosine deaminase-related metal-dependent hydrolase
MLKSGTTAFLEAGTVRFVDAVVDGLVEIGIRGRIGKWVWDLPPEPEVYRQTTDEAVANLDATLKAHRHVAGGRIQAWSMIVGHTTCSDTLWRAAREAADRYQTGLNFHMSPAALDPDGFLAQFGQRPSPTSRSSASSAPTSWRSTACTSTTTRSRSWPGTGAASPTAPRPRSRCRTA